MAADDPRFRRLPPADRAGALVAAGLATLAEGGIAGFTLDRVARTAGVTKGLIAHHFGGKEGLLAACYATAYAPLLQHLFAESTRPPPLPALIDALLSPDQFRAEGLRIWLALWGEIAVNAGLQREHRRHYAAYLDAITRSIAQHAQATGRAVEAPALAAALIALLDGLWLELCIAPDLMDAPRARAAIRALLEPHLGPL